MTQCILQALGMQHQCLATDETNCRDHKHTVIAQLAPRSLAAKSRWCMACAETSGDTVPCMTRVHMSMSSNQHPSMGWSSLQLIKLQHIMVWKSSLTLAWFRCVIHFTVLSCAAPFRISLLAAIIRLLHVGKRGAGVP